MLRSATPHWPPAMVSSHDNGVPGNGEWEWSRGRTDPLAGTRGPESLPRSSAGAVPVPEVDPAIHHRYGNPLGILERILEAGPVYHRGRVQDHQARPAPCRHTPRARAPP